MPANQSPKNTAYRVETDRLVLRCWSPLDALRLRAVLDANDQHLRPMIPFMKDEPKSLEQTAQWLRGLRALFDLSQNYRYAVFNKDESQLLGENMLLTRPGPGALEIGYWIDKDSIGKGIAAEATCALIRVAFEIEDVERVEIICAPENTSSAAIPAKLGFTHEATLKQRARDSEGRIRDLMVWTLFADHYPGSVAASLACQPFDCMGRPIPVNKQH